MGVKRVFKWNTSISGSCTSSKLFLLGESCEKGGLSVIQYILKYTETITSIIVYCIVFFAVTISNLFILYFQRVAK